MTRYCWLILLSLSIGHGVTRAQWNSIAPITFNLTHNSVYFLDDTTGFVVGMLIDTANNNYPGTILRTVDGGQTWDTTLTGNGCGLRSVHFPSRDTGYACGHAGAIYKTIDGGDTWTIVPQPFGSGIVWMSIHFVTNDVGYATSASWGPAILIKTMDGGYTWERIYDVDSNIVAGYSVFSPNIDTTYVVGSGIFFQCSDTGNTWPAPNLIDSSGDRIYMSTYFVDGVTGYAVGNINQAPLIGTIAKTTNGGINWTLTDYSNIPRFQSVVFSSPSVGYAVGEWNPADALCIFATIDGGTTWLPQQVNYTMAYPPTLYSVSAPSDSIAYAVGAWGDIYKTTNGGGPLLAVDEHQETPNRHRVYPLPARDIVNFEFENTVDRTIVIYDQFGREIWRKETSELLVEFPASEFSSGLYFYTILSSDSLPITGKFVIQD